jgi:hypothetical protein
MSLQARCSLWKKQHLEKALNRRTGDKNDHAVG